MTDHETLEHITEHIAAGAPMPHLCCYFPGEYTVADALDDVAAS